MNLKLNEMLMVGAIGEADGAHDGYWKAKEYTERGNETVPDLWISLVWFSDDFYGYYLKRESDDSNDFTIEWRNIGEINNMPDKMHVITLNAVTWADTAKMLVKAIKCHKKYIKN